MSLLIASTNGLASVEIATSSIIKAYKQSDNIPHGLGVIDLPNKQAVSIIAIQKDRPLLHHYALRKETAVKRVILPTKIKALAISPNGQWLAAGSAEGTLYVWNLRSGELKTLHNEAHFQQVSCIAWSKDSSVLVTGGDDARVLIWRLIDLVSNPAASPKHTLTGHRLPITSCVIGNGSFREARLYTASVDATVSVFDIYSGRLLFTLACDSPIYALAVDPAERAVYLAGNGSVHMVPLYYEPPNQARLVSIAAADGSVVSINDTERIFKLGDAKASALALSTDASHLYVGCDDGSVSSWEVGSAQMVKKFRAMKGSVTDIRFVNGEFAPAERFEALPVLQRNLSEGTEALDFVPLGSAPTPDLEELNSTDPDEFKAINQHPNVSSSKTESGNDSEKTADLENELKELKSRHEQLKKMYDALWARHSSK